jgi:hypothetical protein
MSFHSVDGKDLKSIASLSEPQASFDIRHSNSCANKILSYLVLSRKTGSYLQNVF